MHSHANNFISLAVCDREGMRKAVLETCRRHGNTAITTSPDPPGENSPHPPLKSPFIIRPLGLSIRPSVSFISLLFVLFKSRNPDFTAFLPALVSQFSTLRHLLNAFVFVYRGAFKRISAVERDTKIYIKDNTTNRLGRSGPLGKKSKFSLCLLSQILTEPKLIQCSSL